jgi:transcriptional regulator with XRE-family HTH domain
MSSVWDEGLGTAGGTEFGKALRTLCAEREVDLAALSRATGLDAAFIENLASGRERATIAVLARLAIALRTRPIEFMQKTAILSLETYALGLDPLYFLPHGEVRHDARIYMREINPRHAVPETDMTRRNPVLAALADDALLDARGKVELELAYLLRTAVVQLPD